MKLRAQPRAWVVVAALGASACNYYDFEAGKMLGSDDGEPRDEFFTAEEWALVSEHSPLPPPPLDPTNRWADDPAAAELGQALYFERSYSGSASRKLADEDKSCATDCHEPDGWFQLDPQMPESWRSVPPVVNSVCYTWFLWDGGRDSMWAQSLGPPEQQLGSDRISVVRMIADEYLDEYNAIFVDAPIDLAVLEQMPQWGFPGPAFVPVSGENPWYSMTVADQRWITERYVNFGKAVAAYQRRLVSRDAPFDDYVAGDYDAIDEAAKRGLRLFIGKAKCAECHAGPAFTDDDFHNIGVPFTDDAEGHALAIARVLADEFNGAGPYSDDREYGQARLDALGDPAEATGKFRTKFLRQIAETGRYMHASQFATLRDVVEFYSDGPNALLGELDPAIEPLGLTDSEIDDLVAFLQTLTGEPVAPELRRDTSKP